MQAAAPRQLTSIFDLAAAWPLTGSKQADALTRIFSVTDSEARCRAPAPLSQKYGVPQDNHQRVVSVTDRWLLTQTWFNQIRTQKPQTFVQLGGSIVDPTDHGRTCDFCRWQELTAEDTFGRIELASVVTASNLFKYCAPSHGLVLFKHHDPLAFSEPQLAELLLAGNAWIQRAHAEHPTARHPLLIWNCLHRAGASQYHGHAQVLLSEVPLPIEGRRQQAVLQYNATHGLDYHADLAAAHKAAGLLRSIGPEHDRASCFASLSSVKDMEVMIMGPAMTSPSFHRLFFLVMRALIDRLGVASFNAVVENIGLEAQTGEADGNSQQQASQPLIARVVSRGKLSAQASDFGALEVFAGASIGHTDPFRVMAAIDEEMLASS